MDLILCDSVKAEVDSGRTAPVLRACNDLSHNPNHDRLQVEMVHARFPYLGPGEVNVLAWGLQFREERRPYLCVLDDKRARSAADSLQVEKIGVIGLLRLLEDRGVLNHVQRAALEATLQQTGFFYHE
jgi:predicted nucleic acid-binding protein